jgi:hypothetical protein
MSRAVGVRKVCTSPKTYSLSLNSYKAENLASRVFWANLMHLVLRILKFDILRVTAIQIPTKKGSTLSFVKQISP